MWLVVLHSTWLGLHQSWSTTLVGRRTIGFAFSALTLLSGWHKLWCVCVSLRCEMWSGERALRLGRACSACFRYNVTRQSFIGCMRKIEVFSRGTTKINLEDEYSLYVGMYRGCQLQVSLTGCWVCCRLYPRDAVHRLAVWFSGNALVSINAVALHRARLVLGWVTAFGQVNCLVT